MNKFLQKAIGRIIMNSKFLRKIVDSYERHINITQINRNNKYLNGWSFVIVTGGSCPDILCNSLESILKEFKGKDNYEIIVVGQNKDFPLINEHIIYKSYIGVNLIPGWITYKKNIGVSMANYDKCVIMHDYIALGEGWLSGFDRFHQDFDVCTNRILFKDGRRGRDWTVYDYPHIGAALLPYGKNSEFIYISGAYFVVKTLFFLHNKLDESLRWGEAEDIEWSLRIRNNTRIVFNINSYCKFVKNKTLDEAPYSQIWEERTLKLYREFGYDISHENYETFIKSN